MSYRDEMEWSTCEVNASFGVLAERVSGQEDEWNIGTLMAQPLWTRTPWFDQRLFSEQDTEPLIVPN